MNPIKPYVTIGLPVYNGERYISFAIESVLAQTYTNFELLISDNGSTDETARICRSYAAADDRVQYYRSEVNRGAAWNYNRVFELASGTYFRWLAHDDALEKTLLEKSVAVLDQQPDVVLCFTWVKDLDATGQEILVKQSTVGSDLVYPHARFRGLSTVRPSHNCEEVFGLIRAAILAQTKLIDNYPDSDRTLLAALGLHGRFYELAEPLFLHRIHDQGSVVVNPTRQERYLWFNPDLAGRLVFPNWRQLGELLLAVWRGPIAWGERMRCYMHMLVWVKRRRKELRGDIVWATKQLF